MPKNKKAQLAAKDPALLQHLIEKIPPILTEQGGFKPSALLQNVVWVFVMQIREDIAKDLERLGYAPYGDREYVTMPRICEALGCQRDNWYQWRRLPGFETWLEIAITSLFEKNILRDIYLNLLSRARTTHDPALIKLALQRFDKRFIPQTASSNQHIFPGYEPGNAEEQAKGVEDSKRRQRECMEKMEQEKTGAITVESTALTTPGNGFEPLTPEQKAASDLRHEQAKLESTPGKIPIPGLTDKEHRA